MTDDDGASADGFAAADYPAWRIWRAEGGTGVWLATRRYRLTDDQLNAGLYATLCADGADELRGELDRQGARATRLARARR